MIDPASEGHDAYFQITKGGLREVSVVMYPNNLEASIQTLEYLMTREKPTLAQLRWSCVMQDYRKKMRPPRLLF